MVAELNRPTGVVHSERASIVSPQRFAKFAELNQGYRQMIREGGPEDIVELAAEGLGEPRAVVYDHSTGEYKIASNFRTTHEELIQGQNGTHVNGESWLVHGGKNGIRVIYFQDRSNPIREMQGEPNTRIVRESRPFQSVGIPIKRPPLFK